MHVFLERREQGLDSGDAGFLYPFLGREKQDTGELIPEVAGSILMKVADDARLRARWPKRWRAKSGTSPPPSPDAWRAAES